MQPARDTGPYCGGPSLGPLQGDEGARRLLVFGGKLSVQRLRKRFPAARAHTVWCIGCSGATCFHKSLPYSHRVGKQEVPGQQ